MSRQTRRHRRKSSPGLGAFLLPAVAGVFAIFVATHYAVDWGTANGPVAAAVDPRPIPAAIAEAQEPDTGRVATQPRATPVPTRPPSTSLPASAASPVITDAFTAFLPSSQQLTRTPF